MYSMASQRVCKRISNDLLLTEQMRAFYLTLQTANEMGIFILSFIDRNQATKKGKMNYS